MKIRYRSNLASGIASLVFSALLFWLIPLQIGVEQVVSYGVNSRTIPYGIAIVLAVCGVALIVQSLVFKKDSYKEIVLHEEIPEVLLFAALLVYIFIFEKEWPLSTAALGCITLWLSKCKKWYYYLIVAALAIGMYFLFVNVLHIRLRSILFGS